jgi:hypothetical protein
MANNTWRDGQWGAGTIGFNKQQGMGIGSWEYPHMPVIAFFMPKFCNRKSRGFLMKNLSLPVSAN